VTDAFSEFALLLAIAAAAGAVSMWLRQPLLIAYILVGIAVSPAGFDIVSAHEQVELLSHVGVAVLLFLVGLKLDLNHVRHIGPVALATGLGQLAFTIALGFLLLLGLGKGLMEAIYVAVALTFSSTIIIIKLLSDKRELDSLHGRIAVGFLIVQDLAVVVAMMVMSTLRSDGGEGWTEVALSLGLRLLVAGAALYVLIRFVLPGVVDRMARSQELLLIFAIAWGTGLAALGEWTGFSREAGAFLAGFALASTRYRDAVTARLTGIRDFLLLFFFIGLGAQLEFSALGEELLPALLLSLFVLVGNPLIVMAIMGYMGYRKRTGFMAGLTVAQISEFSIVFVAMGISLGHVDSAALGLTTMVGLVTITLSTYMILYSHSLYERFSPLLGVFERAHPHREMVAGGEPPAAGHPEVVVFGLGVYGRGLVQGLRDSGLGVLGVDFDPEVTRDLAAQGLPVRLGDCTEPDFLESLPLREGRWVVCTLPDLASSLGLMAALRAHGYQGRVAVVARRHGDDAALERAGADVVLNPLRDAIDHAAASLGRTMNSRENAS
jgi:Kef-type K+ transport system membrane component KefB